MAEVSSESHERTNEGFDPAEEELDRDNGSLDNQAQDTTTGSKLLYSVDDVPPWHWSLFLGFQVERKTVEETILP